MKNCMPIRKLMSRENHFSTYHQKKHTIKGILTRKNYLKDLESLFSTMILTMKANSEMVMPMMMRLWLSFQMEGTTEDKWKTHPWMVKECLHTKIFTRLKESGKMAFLKEMPNKGARNKVQIIMASSNQDSSKVKELTHGITVAANIKVSLTRAWCTISLEELKPKVESSTMVNLRMEKDKDKAQSKHKTVYWKEISREMRLMALVDSNGKTVKSTKGNLENQCLTEKEK